MNLEQSPDNYAKVTVYSESNTAFGSPLVLKGEAN